MEYNLENDIKEEYINYECLLLDINIKHIIDKIKIVSIKNLSIILNYNNNFNINRFLFDDNKYSYELIKINKLMVGIKDTEIEEIFPKNNESIYASIIQYEKNVHNIENKFLNDIKSIFCLLLIKKPYINSLNDQEIALYLITLQYWNYILKTYLKYEWIDNLLAFVKIDEKCFVYSLKFKKKDIEIFYNKCKNYKYDFEDIIIEKLELKIDDQKEIIKYLDFGVFDIFNHNIFKHK